MLINTAAKWLKRLLTTLTLLLFFNSAHALTLKIATAAPDGTTWMNSMRAAAKEITEKTQGRVKLKFYPGGVMGNDKSVLKKIRLGQLHGGALTAGSLASIYPSMQIYTLPLIFNNYNEIDHVRPVIDPLLKEGILNEGFTVLGISEGGFAYLMSSGAVRSVDELKQHKLWIPEDDVLDEALFRKMGVHPVSLPLADVYTGLQTGLIDTIGATPTGALAFQWHTRVNFVTDLPLLSVFGTLVIDNRRFDKISPADQVAIKEIVGRYFSEMDKLNRSDNKSALQAMQKMGIEFVRPEEQEIAYWKRTAVTVIEELGSNAASPVLYDRLKKLLAEYRAKSSNAPTN